MQIICNPDTWTHLNLKENEPVIEFNLIEMWEDYVLLSGLVSEHVGPVSGQRTSITGELDDITVGQLHHKQFLAPGGGGVCRDVTLW